jgi:hypothetical protein
MVENEVKFVVHVSRVEEMQCVGIEGFFHIQSRSLERNKILGI